LQKAVAWLDDTGLASPCLDDISHAVAGMLKRYSQHHPAFARFLSAGGRVSATLKHTLLACLAPPSGRTTARFMHGHRLCPWATRGLELSLPGGAKRGSLLARLRASLEQLPVCKALIKRLQSDARGLLACQQTLTTRGRSHNTRAQCEPLLDTMPASALRQECRASLDFARKTATTLGLDHVGLPISSDAIASLFGVAKQHGVGQTQDATRIALRLPALCGVPTRAEAKQVLAVSGARQQEVTGQLIALTEQRRDVLGHPERLESLRQRAGASHVELLPRPKNRSNRETIVKLSTGYENQYGPRLADRDDLGLIENTGPPDIREAALTR